MDKGRRLIEYILRNPAICEDGRISTELLRQFSCGYPVKHLRPLLLSPDEKVVHIGIVIASELGAMAVPLLGDVARLLANRDLFVRFYAIDSILACATGKDGKILASAVLLLNDLAGAVRRKVLDLLSRASAEQLNAALTYIQTSELDSVHVHGLRFLTQDHAPIPDEVLTLIRSDNPLLRKYGVAAAARAAAPDNGALIVAASMDDEDVRLFARDVLSLRAI